MKRFSPSPSLLPTWLACLACSLAWIGSPAGAAEPLQPGDPFPSLTAEDQHERDYAFAPGTRTVLVSFDMATGKKANAQLAKQGAEFLGKHQAIYVANIYGMPGIGRVFALPKMRRYPHRIILADQEHLLDRFPRKEDQVTVMKLDPKATIQSITFWDPESKDITKVIP